MSAEETIRRPFTTPLTEVSAQIDLSTAGLVEFRAAAFHGALKEEYPRIQRLPVVLVGEPVPNQQFHVPAYRFFTGDGKRVVQHGPRMMSVNALEWSGGFEEYRKAVHVVFDHYATTMPDELVLGFSLGFYNRIPVIDLAEARKNYRLRIDDEGVMFQELSYQTLHECKAGVVVTQVATAQPDERLSENHLVVNNVVRHILPEPRSVRDVLPEWREWLEAAHDVAKEVFWSSLTPEAQQSWKQVVPR